MSMRIRGSLKTAGMILAVTVFCSGCKYDGSMLQMNSDSPSPFLGLQWSVRNEVPRHAESGKTVRLVRADYARAERGLDNTNETVELAAPLIAKNPSQDVVRPAGLVPTSDSQRTTGRVRYSLERGSDPAANLADEMSNRLRQF